MELHVTTKKKKNIRKPSKGGLTLPTVLRFSEEWVHTLANRLSRLPSMTRPFERLPGAA